MRHSFLKTILLLFLFVILTQAVDYYFFDRKINNFGTVIIQRPTSYLFSRMESAGFFFRGLVKVKNSIKENEGLKKENLNLLSQLANYEDLKNENDFLRSALNISPRFNLAFADKSEVNDKIVYANIYQFRLGVNGYDVLINQGASSGISEGDTVITEEGVLVGLIERVYENFSRALVVSDTDFSVTAKVLNSETIGIARGALAQGLYFDLIIQSDVVKEGDVVVSSGTDLIPPGLIVGTVSYVETGEVDLFKKVRIKPAMGEVRIGRVLIIRN